MYLKERPISLQGSIFQVVSLFKVSYRAFLTTFWYLLTLAQYKLHQSSETEPLWCPKTSEPAACAPARHQRPPNTSTAGGWTRPSTKSTNRQPMAVAPIRSASSSSVMAGYLAFLMVESIWQGRILADSVAPWPAPHCGSRLFVFPFLPVLSSSSSWLGTMSPTITRPPKQVLKG